MYNMTRFVLWVVCAGSNWGSLLPPAPSHCCLLTLYHLMVFLFQELVELIRAKKAAQDAALKKK